MENQVRHQSFTIKQLSNKELLFRTKFLAQKERDIHIKVLRHLAEVDSRKLFFRQGFSSLFDYAVRELAYSEGAAYQRIKAMKLCLELPETANRLQSGKLSLSVASQLQVFFEKQNKKAKQEARKELLKKSPERNILVSAREEQTASKEQQSLIEKSGENLKMREGSQNEDSNRVLNISSQPLSQKEKENLVQRVEGCSTRATEKLLSEADPSLSLLKKEKIRFLEKGKVEVKIVIDEKCHKSLKKLKNLLSHRNPNLSYGELISILSKEALKKHDPRMKNIRQRKEEKIQEKPSVKKQEFKDKSVELAVTSAPKLREKNKIPEHLETLSEKSVISALRSEQIDQYFKETSPFAPKLRQKSKKISRSIPSHLRKYIWERDKGQCTYVHHETNRRCTCRRLLQIDHIQPFALGGRSEKENLRLLCAGHNQYRK